MRRNSRYTLAKVTFPFPFQVQKQHIVLRKEQTDMEQKIEFRCKRTNCNRLLMNYYITGLDTELHLEGVEFKCEKCKRVFRLCKYTEKQLTEHSKNGVFRV